MTREQFNQLVREDLFRYAGRLGFGAFLRAWRHEAGFRITFMMRLCRWLRACSLTRYGLYHIAAFLHQRSAVRHGVFIDPMTEVGGGLYLPHALNIVVNRRCRIGRNVNLSQGITLGIANRGSRAGTPEIGDRVYIGPGAVIFGAIRIGDEAAIGANSVVTKDAPDRSVVVGVPGKVISHEGSDGYVNSILTDTLATTHNLPTMENS
ncbi:MAG: serine acetyltransferase [Verrucomicrobiaceae bacterium]|nr:MAG: serine acetyltransferase [Verrucomicrobiaceae bacterium]